MLVSVVVYEMNDIVDICNTSTISNVTSNS